VFKRKKKTNSEKTNYFTQKAASIQEKKRSSKEYSESNKRKYRVGQIKWHHFTVLLVGLTHECIHKILQFLAHINYIMQKMRWCLVYVIMSTLIRQRALQTWVLSICIIAVLLSLKYLHWNSAFFLHSLQKFYSKQIRLVLLFGSIYQHFTFLQLATCFTWFCC